MAAISGLDAALDMSALDATDVIAIATSGTPGASSNSLAQITFGEFVLSLSGSGFDDFVGGLPTSGVIDTVLMVDGETTLHVSGLAVGAEAFANLIDTNDVAAIEALLFGGDDVIIGSAGDDIVRGYDGLDSLVDLGGNDVLDGGAGRDAIYYQTETHAASAGVTVSLLLQGAAQDTVNFGTDTLFGIEDVFGTSFNDTIAGDNGANRLSGLNGGDDTISGHGGDDHITIGGGGSHIISGGAGSDTLSFEGGPDTGITFSFRSLGESQATGWGSVVATGIENIIGTDFNDTITGDDGDNHIIGGAGNDRITLAFDKNGSGLSNNDIVDGGDGDDVITNNDTGDVLVIGGAGADAFIVGRGAVTLSYASSVAGVALNLLARTASGGHAEGDAMTGGVRGLIGSAFDDVLIGNTTHNTIRGGAGVDYLNGGEANDILHGDAGSDRIVGGLGNDTLFGGAGADKLEGGAGVDTASYADAEQGVTLRLWKGARGDAVGGDAQGDTFLDIEAFVGSAFVDSFVGRDNIGHTFDGGGGNDYLNGLGGNDTLIGGLGVDRLRGGDGDDALDGGVGADRIEGEAGADTLGYSGSAAAVSVKLWQGRGFGGDAEGDRFSGIENVIGSAFSDVIVGEDNVANMLDGGSGADYLNGLGGDDLLKGGDGNDQLAAGAGDDTLDGAEGDDRLEGGDGDDFLITGFGADRILGGDGVDTVSFADAASGFLTIRLFSNQATSSVTGQSDTIIDVENVIGRILVDTIIGSDYANVLDGSGGDDSLFGLAGNDVLIGGTGADRMTGGDGADTFVIDAHREVRSRDRIEDFTLGEDIIHVNDRLGLGLAAGALSANAFTIGTMATESFHRILYDPSTGAIMVDADGVEGQSAAIVAIVTAGLALTHEDFFIL